MLAVRFLNLDDRVVVIQGHVLTECHHTPDEGNSGDLNQVSSNAILGWGHNDESFQ